MERVTHLDDLGARDWDAPSRSRYGSPSSASAGSRCRRSTPRITVGRVLVSGSPAKPGRLVARVRTGRGPEPDGRDGLVDTRAMATIYESAETGRQVEL